MMNNNNTVPTYKVVSVRQEAADRAEAAGRKPCADKAHPANCLGGCAGITIRETMIDGLPAFVASGPGALDMLARGTYDTALLDGIAYYRRTRG